MNGRSRLSGMRLWTAMGVMGAMMITAKSTCEPSLTNMVLVYLRWGRCPDR